MGSHDMQEEGVEPFPVLAILAAAGKSQGRNRGGEGEER